eukprot:6421462-Amphidinium_carterae.1
MAHGGPTGDPQVSADLSTVRVWNRQLLAASDLTTLRQPLEQRTQSWTWAWSWLIVLDRCQTKGAGARIASGNVKCDSAQVLCGCQASQALLASGWTEAL